MICTIVPEVLHSVPKINVNIEGANDSKTIVCIKNITTHLFFTPNIFAIDFNIAGCWFQISIQQSKKS